MNKRIYLCLAHMSGKEQAFIQEAFDTNWVVPLGPNVNGFEEDLKQFVSGIYPASVGDAAEEKGRKLREVVALSSGTAAVRLAWSMRVNPRTRTASRTTTWRHCGSCRGSRHGRCGSRFALCCIWSGPERVWRSTPLDLAYYVELVRRLVRGPWYSEVNDEEPR